MEAAAATRKTYHGFRDHSGRCHIEVRTADQALGRPLKHEERHSPTGFEWGYEGSGPADTARSILADYLGFVPQPAFYQRFKYLVVSQLDRDRWEFSSIDVAITVAAIKEDMGIDCLACCDSGMVWDDNRPGRPGRVTCDLCTEGRKLARELGDD